jgi:PAS domain S-box-containing protein
VKKKEKCWEYFECTEKECPVLKSKELMCWLIPGTYCRNEIQGKFLDKIEMCLECEPFRTNLDLDSMKKTLMVVNAQVMEFREMVKERDSELETISMEMAIGLSEVFEALGKISSGDPLVRISETSEHELISKLKHMVNLTAENLGEIVDLSHEFAIGLAEYFDVLYRVSKGDMGARVSGTSPVELLESLKKMTNEMIESVSEEIIERAKAEGKLRKARDELEQRVSERTVELMKANEQLKREIEERKWTQEELKASEEKYRFLFHYDPNPLFLVEMRYAKIHDVNDSAIKTYQYSREEFMQMSIFDLLHEDGARLFRKEIMSSPHEEHLFIPRLWSKRKDGHHFFIDLYARAEKIGETANGISHPMLIIRASDITRRLEQETQLIQASKMATLGEMSTGMAHELNQPLNVIKIGSDFFKKMIKRGNRIPEEQVLKVSTNISEQVDRATTIINHLRDFGRKSDFRLSSVDINEPIREIFTLLGQQLKLRNIEVDLNLAENLPKISAEKNRFEQIFLNLVTNARDAMEAKGEGTKKVLTVTTGREKDRVVTLISDTGTGMSKDVRARIFEPFFTTKEVGKGTGLGLSIAYNLVKDFEGEIEVESIPDEGTTFRLSFPV